jgi:hypothetical protein
MKIKQTFFSLLLIFTLNFDCHSQVLVGSDETSSEKKTKPKKQIDGSSAINFTTNWSSTSRSLLENEAPFGDSLSYFKNETPLNTWSFGLSISNKVNSFIKWEGGICILRNGERYSFAQGDSSYSYTTRYSYIGMPIKLVFNYGETINFYGGFGLIPQIFLGYNKAVKWTNNDGASDGETLKVKEGYAPSSFVLSTVFNVGISMKIQERWSVFVSPEYRLQLNSSFDEKDEFIHKARALGISFGLIRYL